MDKNKLDKYIDLLKQDFEQLENTLKFLSFEYLLKGYKNPETWYKVQQDNLKQYKTKIVKLANEKLKEINSHYYNTLLLAYVIATGVNPTKDDVKKELTIAVDEKFSNKINLLLNENKVMVANLTANITNNYIQSVDKVGKTTMFNLPKTEELYKQITKSIDNFGVQDNLKVVYKNKRVVDWKVYTEMNVRTTMSQEITDLQIQSGKQSKIVFWLCSQHSTCADDHLKYQGKCYYDEDYKTFGFDAETLAKIEAYITSKKMLSVQQVKNGKPYLTTRPNCRHYFQPISIKDALNNNETALLDRLGMNKGKGDKKQYEDLCTQRYNERQIRKWKTEMQKYEMETTANPNDIYTQQKLKYCKGKVKEWQSTQRQLLKGKDYLERDYNRETNEILVNDLGYRFKHLTEK